jgi:glycosyltransferase involved in cell wall biosynthesis
MNKLSILIPAYNEANTIQQTLRKIREVKLIDGFLKEVIIIYDCSIDETAIYLLLNNKKAISQELNY